MSELLCDTDVLIDYLRDVPQAVEYLESLQHPPFVSAITVAELYAGVRDGDERTILDQFISAFRIIEVDEEIAVKGGLFRREFLKSHSIGLADAIIAASAVVRQIQLVTLNVKHFPMLADVLTPYGKP